MSIDTYILCQTCGDNVCECEGKCDCEECVLLAFKHLR